MSCGYDNPTSWQSFSSTQMSGEHNIKEAPSLPFQQKGTRWADANLRCSWPLCKSTSRYWADSKGSDSGDPAIIECQDIKIKCDGLSQSQCQLLPGVLVDLATWMDLCYRVWQLWRQKINRITRSFMKADLAGKTGEHMAGQVLSRSDRYWQWLYLGCAEIPFYHQQSAPRRAALWHGCQVPRSPAH